VAPYRLAGKQGKNDAADAAAICEAGHAATLRHAFATHMLHAGYHIRTGRKPVTAATVSGGAALWSAARARAGASRPATRQVGCGGRPLPVSGEST